MEKETKFISAFQAKKKKRDKAIVNEYLEKVNKGSKMTLIYHLMAKYDITGVTTIYRILKSNGVEVTNQ